jgi:hypothetical protein
MRIASSMRQLYTTAVDNYERRVTDVRKPTVSIAKNFRTPRSTEKLYAPMVARSLVAPATHVPQLHLTSTYLELFAQNFLCREILHLVSLADLQHVQSIASLKKTT